MRFSLSFLFLSALIDRGKTRLGESCWVIRFKLEMMKVIQIKHLTYREIDGLFYVINSKFREAVVLNQTAFEILQSANDIEEDKLYKKIIEEISDNSKANEKKYQINYDEFKSFLYVLEEAHLIKIK